ncbi:MAG: hypothetical protein ABR575_00245 [Actinomycetota bacterium]
MSIEEEWAYRRLLDHAWLEGSIPADARQLKPLLRDIPIRRVREIWEGIQVCWAAHPTEHGRMVNPRQERLREELDARTVERSVSGGFGADQRWGRYGCTCGRAFSSQRAFAGHRRHCKVVDKSVEKSAAPVQREVSGRSAAAQRRCSAGEGQHQAPQEVLRDGKQRYALAFALKDLALDRTRSSKTGPSWPRANGERGRKIARAEQSATVWPDDDRGPGVVQAIRLVVPLEKRAEYAADAALIRSPAHRDQIHAAATDILAFEREGMLDQMRGRAMLIKALRSSGVSTRGP